MPEPIVEARHGNRLIDIFPFLMKNFWRKIDNIIMPTGTYLQTDKVKAKSSSGLLLVDDSDTEGLKVEDGGAVSVAGNWRLKSETEGGTERLTLTAVGASAASEFFLHPTGSANTSRLTITDAVNSVNYEGIEIEATTSANRIGSIAAGTGTVQALEFQISNSTKMSLTTAANLRMRYSATNGQEYGFINSEESLHLSQNAYYDGSWKSISGDHEAIVLQTNADGGDAFRISVDTTVAGADETLSLSPLFVVDLSGNVGINTTNPQVELEVARSGAGNSAIAISDPNDSYTARVKLWHIDGSGGAIDLFNDSQTITAKIRSYASSSVQAYFTAGNVGIGTATPGNLLHVYGAAANGSHIVNIQNTTNGGEFLKCVNYNGNTVLSVESVTGGDGQLLLKSNSGSTMMAATKDGNGKFYVSTGYLAIADSVGTNPSTAVGSALIYVDASDGDLKVKFGDGTTKTIVTDT